MQAAFCQINTVQIDSIVNSKIDAKDPSLFVGVVLDGEIVYKKYRGMASLQNQVAVHSASRNNVASVAKQFTALMVLDLHLKGQLDLDDDFRKYLPELYKTVPSTIKIRHLINHTSGVRDYADLLSIKRDPWWSQLGMNNDDVIENILSKQETLAFPAGSSYIYSNSGYTLLTKIIEVVTKQDFHDYSDAFFKSLGMDNTAFAKDYMLVIPNQVLPYSDWGDGIWKQYPMLTDLYGDGFLYTTLEDQLQFEQAIQQAVEQDNELLIKSQQPIPNSEIATYGFGLELTERLGYKAVHHSGGTGSYHAQTVRIPSENLSVFVMSSNSRIWSGYIADEIIQSILPKKISNIKYAEAMQNGTFLANEKVILGKYRSPQGAVVQIQKSENGIQWKMDNNNPMPLDLTDNNLYEMRRWKVNKLGFENTLKGMNMILFEPGGNKIEHHKLEKYKASNKDINDLFGEYYSEELEIGFRIASNKDGEPTFQMDGQSEPDNLEIIHKNDLLFNDYRLSVVRDKNDKILKILLTTNRALNVVFVKKKY